MDISLNSVLSHIIDSFPLLWVIFIVVIFLFDLPSKHYNKCIFWFYRYISWSQKETRQEKRGKDTFVGLQWIFIWWSLYWWVRKFPISMCCSQTENWVLCSNTIIGFGQSLSCPKCLHRYKIFFCILRIYCITHCQWGLLRC